MPRWTRKMRPKRLHVPRAKASANTMLSGSKTVKPIDFGAIFDGVAVETEGLSREEFDEWRMGWPGYQMK